MGNEDLDNASHCETRRPSIIYIELWPLHFVVAATEPSQVLERRGGQGPESTFCLRAILA